MTTSVILNAQRNISHGDVLHLGHSDGGCLVAVHASTDMDWDSVMHASFGAYLGFSAEE